MTTTDTRTKIPAPLYAAAGASDLAYQQLRKLPAKVAELRGKVAANEVDFKVDVDRLREAARRNANAVVAGAQAAQDRAAALYAELVARGEQVVRGARAPIRASVTVETTDALESAKPAAKAARKPRPADEK